MQIRDVCNLGKNCYQFFLWQKNHNATPGFRPDDVI